MDVQIAGGIDGDNGRATFEWIEYLDSRRTPVGGALAVESLFGWMIGVGGDDGSWAHGIEEIIAQDEVAAMHPGDDHIGADIASAGEHEVFGGKP